MDLLVQSMDLRYGLIFVQIFARVLSGKNLRKFS